MWALESQHPFPLSIAMCFTRRKTKQEVYNSGTCVLEVHTHQKSGRRGGGGGGCCGGGGGDFSDDDDDYANNIKTGRDQDHGVGAAKSGGKNDCVLPGDITGGGGNNIQGGGNQNQGGGGGAARNGGKNDGMSPGEAKYVNNDEDATSGGGGGRNHNGHVDEKAGEGGGNMSHMGPMDSSDAESSDTSIEEMPSDEMGSRKAYRHQYARPQPAINYAPAPMVNSYVHFFGEEKTGGCSIM